MCAFRIFKLDATTTLTYFIIYFFYLYEISVYYNCQKRFFELGSMGVLIIVLILFVTMS